MQQEQTEVDRQQLEEQLEQKDSELSEASEKIQELEKQLAEFEATGTHMLKESEAELTKNAGVLEVLRIKMDQFREENE